MFIMQYQSSLGGDSGYGEEFGGQSATPPPLDASKTEPLHGGIPCLEIAGAVGMQWGGSCQRPGRELQKSSCQQYGSQSGFGWEGLGREDLPPSIWALLLPAVALATHTTLLASVLSPVKAVGWISINHNTLTSPSLHLCCLSLPGLANPSHDPSPPKGQNGPDRRQERSLTQGKLHSASYHFLPLPFRASFGMEEIKVWFECTHSLVAPRSLLWGC